MTDITKEMQKIIAENLPAATAGEMSKFINEAVAIKEKFEAAKDTIEAQDKEIEADKNHIGILNRLVEQAGDLKAKASQLDQRTEALRIRESQLKLEIVTVQLCAAQTTNETIERLVEKVFGHPSVQVSTTTNKPMMSDPGSGIAPYQQGSMTEHQDTTTREGKE